MIVIKEIDYRGEPGSIRTEAFSSWVTEGDTIVYKGTMDQLYRNLNDREHEIVDKYILKKREVVEEIIWWRHPDLGQGDFVTVSKLESHAHHTDKIYDVMGSLKLSKKVRDLNIVFLDDYTIKQIAEAVAGAIKEYRLYIAAVPASFWKSICTHYELSIDAFIRMVDNGFLWKDISGRIHGRPGVSRGGIVRNQEFSTLVFNKVTSALFVSIKELITYGESFKECMFGESGIKIAPTERCQLVHKFEWMPGASGASVLFKSCVFDKCVFESEKGGKAYFIDCKFIDCTIKNRIGRFKNPHFIGKTIVDDGIWVHIDGLYRVNNLTIEYEDEKQRFIVYLDGKEKEYTDPGNMIGITYGPLQTRCEFAFRNAADGGVLITVEHDHFMKKLEKAVKMIFG